LGIRLGLSSSEKPGRVFPGFSLFKRFNFSGNSDPLVSRQRGDTMMNLETLRQLLTLALAARDSVSKKEELVNFATDLVDPALTLAAGDSDSAMGARVALRKEIEAAIETIFPQVVEPEPDTQAQELKIGEGVRSYGIVTRIEINDEYSVVEEHYC
jgi:hypothetical protein